MAKTAKKKPVPKIEHAQVIPIEQPKSQLPMVQNTPDMLLAMAIEKGTPIDQLEKLMDLQERWLERQAKALFLQAKTDFQSEVPTLIKSKHVSFRTKAGDQVDYYHAELGKIADALKPLLKKFGLSYDWDFVDFKDDKGVAKIKVICKVSHVAGYTKETSMEGFHDTSGSKSNIQASASTITYLQRYTLIGALGLSTDSADNDGRSAPGSPPPPSPVKKTKITDKAWDKLLERAKNGELVSVNAAEQLDLSVTQIEALYLIEKAKGHHRDSQLEPEPGQSNGQ